MTYQPKTPNPGNRAKTATAPGTFVTAAAVGGVPVYISRANFLSAFAAKAVESAEGAIVTTVGPTIVDGSGNVYAINAAGQVVTNTIADTGTSTVVEIAYHLGQLYQKNAAGSWYTRTSPAAAYVFVSDPFAVVVNPS